MIDPNKITEYNLNKYKLQEQLLFWIAVAGKKAATIAPRINSLLKTLHFNYGYQYFMPFNAILEVNEKDFSILLKSHGIGCYHLKAKAMQSVARSGLNLKTCSCEDLEKIPGIGKKTSRCFIMHTRKDARVAGLDTHLLKFLSALGYDVPKSTPSSTKRYNKIECMYLDIVDQTNRTAAELDLLVWRVYSGHSHLEPMLLRIFNGKSNSNRSTS
jgi:endonuclease III